MIRIIKVFIVLLFFISCNKEVQTEKKQTSKVVQLTNDTVNSEAVFLFHKDTTTLINWTEWYKNATDNQLKFAFYRNHKFDTILAVPPAKGLQIHSESMAKIGMTNSGVLYAVYRRKSKNPKSRFGGHIYYATSNDLGKHWSAEKKLVEDTSSTSQAFFDLALLPDGTLGLIWLDSRTPLKHDEHGKNIFFAKTTANNTFGDEKAIIGSTCECCRTELYVDVAKNIHVAYRNITEKGEFDFDNKGTTEIRDMYYSISKDNGKTFEEPIAISNDNWHINGCPHTGPSLAKTPEALHAVWFTAADHNKGIYYASKKNNDFLARKLLSKEGTHPQMISNDNKLYVVYEMYYEKDNKGYTKIVLDDTKGNQKEISQPLSNNNHAVIAKNTANSYIIAWVNKDTRTPKINYKELAF